MNQDYLESYKTLGLSRATSWDDIKLAYRRQVQIWHPDRHQDGSDEEYRESSEKFLAITTAYENLERYYKENGKLPPIPEKPRPQAAPDMSAAHQEEDTGFSPPPATRRKKPRKSSFPFVKLSLALAAGLMAVVALIIMQDRLERQAQQERYNADKKNLTPHKTESEYGGVYWLEGINRDLKQGSTLGNSSESVGDSMNQRLNETRQ